MFKSPRKRAYAKKTSAYAISALLTLQLAGMPLPAAIAQGIDANPETSEPPVEVVVETPATTVQEDALETQGGTNEPTQTNEPATLGEPEATSLKTQNLPDGIPYTNQNGEDATCTNYTLVSSPAGDDPLQLQDGGWYVAQGTVSISTRIEVQGSAHLILCDGAELIANKGIRNIGGSTLSVYGQSEHTGKLQATGDEHNAAIGGNMAEAGGTFNAYGGHTVAQGGNNAAGIGGGHTSDGGTVLIRGEKTCVEATGGNSGAGIGGGCGSSWSSASNGTGYTGTVTIEGGTVIAKGGQAAAGIGGGNGYKTETGGGTVTISGGTVTATGGSGGAGIGGANGYLSDDVGHTAGADVLITGGNVTATGGSSSPGIGTGSHNATGGSLTVTGGTVNAIGGEGGAGIGGGYADGYRGEKDGDYTVTITGGTVVATHASNYGSGAGIGGGLHGNGVVVKIGGTAHVEATGAFNGAGIGSGSGGLDAGSLEVTGGTVIAMAGANAAGIGTGQSSAEEHAVGSTVTITGGVVKAYGNQQGAAIGGGEYASGGNVTITGGTVLADGRDRYNHTPVRGGAGIGAGCGSPFLENQTTGGTLHIGGDAEVTAIGGQYCAGIGGGIDANGANVTIDGNPTVTAIGGQYGAGIGGGWKSTGKVGGAGGTVSIKGGTVTAQAGDPDDKGPTEAIGHGSGCDDSGTTTLYDAAKVQHGAQAEGVGATTSLAAQRVAGCRDFWARISPCDHIDDQGASTATFAPTANKLHHTSGCTLCLAIQSDAEGNPIEYDHELDAEGVCVCGVHAHKLTFNKNAATATGTMAAADFVEEANYVLPTCGFTRDGYAFAGWNAQADGSGTTYADEAAYTMGTEDAELFAQWRPARFGNITGVKASYTYNGKARQPKPRVKGPEGQSLTEGTDYRLAYANNVNASTSSKKAKVRVIGMDAYASAATATIEFNIKKSTPAAPAAPKKKGVTTTTITVTGTKGCEYSIDGKKIWKKLGKDGTVTFGGLEPEHAYRVVGRVRATANTNASSASKALRVSTARRKASTSYTAHLRTTGWGTTSKDGVMVGTVGLSKRMEALRLNVSSNLSGGVRYRVHVAHKSWLSWAKDGGVSGTTGESRRMEAVQIKLYGNLAKEYSVYYRVHARKLGWMAWAHDGESAGTVGESRRTEALQVVLVRKGAKAPAGHYKGVMQAYPSPFRKNGPRAK